jgi:hypothetical protein
VAPSPSGRGLKTASKHKQDDKTSRTNKRKRNKARLSYESGKPEKQVRLNHLDSRFRGKDNNHQRTTNQ